jgi:hypothetical protein
MKRLSGIVIVLLSIFPLLGTEAGAMWIMAADNIDQQIFLSDRQNFDGIFDINSKLPGNDPHIIPNAYVVFEFADNYDGVVQSYTYTNYTQEGSMYSSSGITHIPYYRNYNNYYFDTYEESYAVIAGDYGRNHPSWYDTGVRYINTTYDGNNYFSIWIDESGGLGLWGHYVYYSNDYYTRYYRNDYGYSGSWSILFSLNNSNLTDLSQDGILNFTVSSEWGNMFFTNAYIGAEVLYIVTPEPLTLLLFGFGLAGITGLRRKFRQ